MVICRKMTDVKEKRPTAESLFCSEKRSTVLRGSIQHRMSRNLSTLIESRRNTKAEFKRLKTIVPSIRRKEHVSKLDIILEAIKYIDNLQDQLIDRLTGSRSERQAKLVSLTSQDRTESFDDELFDKSDDEQEEEDLISLSDGYMSDPGLVNFGNCDSDEENSSCGDSHASLEL